MEPLPLMQASYTSVIAGLYEGSELGAHARGPQDLLRTVVYEIACVLMLYPFGSLLGSPGRHLQYTAASASEHFLRGSEYLNSKELGLKEHIHHGCWDLSPR